MYKATLTPCSCWMSSWVIVIGCHQMPSADVIVVACCVHCGQRHCGQNCCLFGLHYLLPHFALSPLPPPTTNIDTTRIYSHHQCQNHFQHQHHHRPLQHQHVKQCETIRSTPKKWLHGFTILWNSMKGGAISPAEKGRVLHVSFWMILVVLLPSSPPPCHWQHPIHSVRHHLPW